MTSICKWVALVAVALAPTVTQALPANNIRTYTGQVIQSVIQGAESCGVTFVTAPQGTLTPADYLAMNRHGNVIAHVLDRGNYFAVKRPLGGNVHWIEYSMRSLDLFTPEGKVAGANRFTTGHGWEFNYYCRSTPVTGHHFDLCIAHGFINVLVSRLCAG